MTDEARPTLKLPKMQAEINPKRRSIRAGAAKKRGKLQQHSARLQDALKDQAGSSDAKANRNLQQALQPTALASFSDEIEPSSIASIQTNQTNVRISKLMAERRLCSRREADVYIARGWVYVDGRQISELGTRADPSAEIVLDKAAKTAQQRQVTILLHKPVGYVSGQPEPGRIPAVTLIQPENQYRLPGAAPFHPTHLKGLAPAGRLEIDSTGLLVLTQDGRIARRLIGENSKVDKEYLVRVEGQLDESGLALLRHGLSLDGKPLRPAKVEQLNNDQLRFILNEGRKRQIRRMCELVGLRVVGLKRVRIGKVRLGNLPLGQWRYLSENEIF